MSPLEGVMRFKLAVFNPSDYPRAGHVTAPWQAIAKETGIDPEGVALLDESDQPLPFQIDRVDKSDPSRDTFSFPLPKAIPRGAEDYSVPSAYLYLAEGLPAEPQAAKVGIDVRNPGTAEERVELWNEILFVCLSLSPSPGQAAGRWYAGSADSVRLNGKEILDAFAAELDWWGHDPEKRCMQVDKLRLWSPAWEDAPFQEASLFDHPYQLVSRCEGPVRAAVTIASSPFHYQYSDLSTRQPGQLECRLYRIISLYAGADYVLEELYVKADPPRKPRGRGGGAKAIDLCFSPHYFAYMDMGFEPAIYRFEQIPDWFAVGALHGHRLEPHPGYGFATDVHVASFAHPHPGYPNWQRAYRTFSWELPPCRSAKCLHLFMRGQPAGFDSMTGRAWYEHIFKPLEVRRASPAES
jgi:hypothetical protein